MEIRDSEWHESRIFILYIYTLVSTKKLGKSFEIFEIQFAIDILGVNEFEITFAVSIRLLCIKTSSLLLN